MTTTRPRRLSTHLVAGALAAAALVAVAQAAIAAPNLQGTWKIAAPTSTLTPASGAVPFTAQGRKYYDQNKRLRAKGAIDDYDIAQSRCSSPGIPRLMMAPGRFKIRERYGVYTFDFEWNRALRQVDASSLPPKPDYLGMALVPAMTGTAKGHWEGDTLVAESSNLSDRTLLDELVPHGFDLKVTERLRLVDADTLEDRITIADPEYFKRPWDAVLTFKRQPDALFAEDVCLDRVEAKQPAFALQ